MNISNFTSKHVLFRWLPFAVVATAMSGLVLVAGQQNLRMNANDPQIQMAEDSAAALGAGQQIPATPTVTADIAKSLSTFLVIYDDQGKVLASNAQLDGKAVPTLPAGVFNYVRAHNSERVTWSPRPGVRIAAVVSRYQGKFPGFILAGRSLRVVDERILQLEQLVGLAWLATMLATYALVACTCRKQEMPAPTPVATA